MKYIFLLILFLFPFLNACSDRVANDEVEIVRIVKDDNGRISAYGFLKNITDDTLTLKKYLDQTAKELKSSFGNQNKGYDISIWI